MAGAPSHSEILLIQFIDPGLLNGFENFLVAWMAGLFLEIGQTLHQ
jgi:hypothetical protein